jgi:tetratricopeptide (TPR) repeat protein
MVPAASRYVFLGRLKNYLGKPEEAIEVMSEGLRHHPDDVYLLRHRGHRYISVRRLDEAVADLERAEVLARPMADEIEFYQQEVELDLAALILGQPERLLQAPMPITPATLERYRNTYKGTLKSCIGYHLALGYYLRGEFDRAVDAYRATLPHCVDDDMRIATLDWLYMSLQRAGRPADAATLLAGIPGELHVVEGSYDARVRMYRGEIPPEAILDPVGVSPMALATRGYGVANWYLYHGRTEEAIALLRRIVASGSRSAFGYVAAQIDLERLAA